MLKHGNAVKGTLEHANAATSMQQSMRKRAGAAKNIVKGMQKCQRCKKASEKPAQTGKGYKKLAKTLQKVYKKSAKSLQKVCKKSAKTLQKFKSKGCEKSKEKTGKSMEE